MKPHLRHFASLILEEKQTARFARSIAPLLKRGDFINLAGDLGAGKTSFMRLLIRSLMEDEALDVTSPTFSLIHHYELRSGRSAAAIRKIAHADLYRLQSAQEVVELDLSDELEEGLLCVEWAQRGEGFLPLETILLNFDYLSLDDPSFEKARLLAIYLDDAADNLWRSSKRLQAICDEFGR